MQKDRWPPIFAFGVKFSLAQGRQSTLFSFNLREEDSRGREREREREKVMHSDVKRLSALLPSSP